MALSVSGFPEPLRQLETDVDSSRLRGFFGKKQDSNASTRHQSPSSSSPSSPQPSHHLPIFADDQAFLAEMSILQAPDSLPTIPQRQRQISLPRRTPSTVQRHPSLSRLEIGMSSRPSPTSPPLPKPPSLLLQEWSKSPEQSLPLPRPLPAVPIPGPIIESSKSAALRNNTQPRVPLSKVIIKSPSRPRAQTTSPHATSMRYQPMVPDLPDKESKSCPPSALPKSGPQAAIVSPGGHIRPLPRLPPLSVTTIPIAQPRSASARVRRPKSSPSSSDGFSTDMIRSPFDAVPSSWVSKPAQPNPTPPAPPPPTQPLPSTWVLPNRTRSHSRPRRDRSADVPSGSRTPVSPRRPAHRITSPAPITSSPAITPPPSARNSVSIRASTYHAVRPSNSPSSSPSLPSALPTTNRFLSQHAAAFTPSAPSKIVEESLLADAHSITGSLHTHPLGIGTRLSNEDAPPPPATRAPDSPGPAIDVFVDDADYSGVLSRSPSPMRYARPNSRGSVSDDDDDEGASGASSNSRSRAARDQLRAYRRSYRAPASPERSPSPIRYARRSSLDGDGDALLDEPGAGGVPKRRAQPRSYQFDYRAMRESTPPPLPPPPSQPPLSSFVRRSMPAEGKTNGNGNRSKSRRRARSKGSSGNSRPSRSRSPRRERASTPSGSVIDISLPSSVYEDLAKHGQNQNHAETENVHRLRASKVPNEHAIPFSHVTADRAWNESTGAWEAVEKVGGDEKWGYRGGGRDESAVVVTTIQPRREWKEEEMRRVIPMLRYLRVRN